VTGIPQLREAGWFVTGSDRDPVRHLFVRMEEHMDGTGVWTVELHECRGAAVTPARRSTAIPARRGPVRRSN
jgi:hypothetical protein